MIQALNLGLDEADSGLSAGISAYAAERVFAHDDGVSQAYDELPLPE
jgi:hypothetical protein